jgi:hypothetical protein
VRNASSRCLLLTHSPTLNSNRNVSCEQVLITISDGLANSFMEAEEWAALLKSGDPAAGLPAVEMVSVGTNPDNADNYVPQLVQLASAPVDRHMFRVGSPQLLQELVDEIGQAACVSPVPLGNETITINIVPGSDPGTNYFEFVCGTSHPRIECGEEGVGGWGGGGGGGQRA